MVAFLESYEAVFNNADEVAFRALHTADARLVFEFNPGNNVTLDRLVEEMLNLRRQETILTIEDCIAELQRCSGTQFDPQCVDAFVRLERKSMGEGAREQATT